MPHQCLKCGTIFAEGSPQLLKGCPDCGGNRFFYTKEPLSEEQRTKIQDEMGKDINNQLADILGDKGNELFDQAGNWVHMKPNDVKKAIKKHLPEHQEKLKFTSKDLAKIDLLENEIYRKQRIQKALEKTKSSDRPETIDIQPPGNYAIDIKGLLENEPIIIQKDGSYSIHLPSVFKMVENRK